MNFNSPNSAQGLERPAQDAAPAPLIGLAKLMRMAYSGVDLAPLGQQLIARAGADPGCAGANALMDLSTVLQLRGDRDLALSMQAQALGMQQIYSPPTAVGEAAIRVLAIMGPGDLMANTPLEFLLENSDVALDILYIAPYLPLPASLPEHDVLFVAIGESDQNVPLLEEIGSAVQSWPRPVLNMPDRIAKLSRDSACALLQSVPGVVMPETARLDRHVLEQIGREELSIAAVLENGAFPLIVRPVDSHAGRGLDKLDAPAAVAGYLSTMPQGEFYVSRFIDYCGADGLFRKYRIVLIDGHPFVCHMAISSHWMIHYLNAGMADNPEKRAEEARFMADFDEDFARRHAGAFCVIRERMGLDYLGIDCGETADGSLLIFEVDSNMIVHAIDPVDVFPYKQPQMQKVFAAFREMLVNAMKRGLPL
jgi:glutathione synthase/RimK-type ligase-like ATP-grasp enzyme